MRLVYLILITAGFASWSVIKNAAKNKIARPNASPKDSFWRGSSGRAFADKLVWSDEFNFKGLPDSSKWNYNVGGHGWGNNELQCYTANDTLNAIVENGLLKIIAKKAGAKKLLLGHFSSMYESLEDFKTEACTVF